jgi:hypothetical protein
VPRKRILEIVRPHVVSVPSSGGLVGLGAPELELELELEPELEPELELESELELEPELEPEPEPEPEPEALAHPSPMRAGLPAGGEEREPGTRSDDP